MKELLFSLTREDFTFQYYRGSGNGGQKRNVTDSACRCTHPPSGAVATAEDNRQQLQNKRAAWKKCVESPEFKAWLDQEIARANLSAQERRRREEELKRELNSDKVRVEVREDGVWIEQK